jgi:hypothetical protein
MLERRYELQSTHAGQIWLVVAVYATSDAEAIDKVADAAARVLEGGATDLALWDIEIGREREVHRYAGGAKS